MTDVWKRPSSYHENYDLSCVYGQHRGALHPFNTREQRWGQCWGSQSRFLRGLAMLSFKMPHGLSGRFPCCILYCWDTFNCKGQDPHLVWFIASMTYLWLFLKAAPTFREYIYLFIYLFYCFSGKNAVRVISLFLDSASLKVCNFTVLTPCVPMHLSWPVCPVVHTAGLEEHPDITAGSAVSHVSVEELFPRNCWENKKINVFQKFCLACQALILF